MTFSWFACPKLSRGIWVFVLFLSCFSCFLVFYRDLFRVAHFELLAMNHCATKCWPKALGTLTWRTCSQETLPELQTSQEVFHLSRSASVSTYIKQVGWGRLSVNPPGIGFKCCSSWSTLSGLWERSSRNPHTWKIGYGCSDVQSWWNTDSNKQTKKDW